MGDGALLVEIDKVATIGTARQARALAERVQAARASEPAFGAAVAGAASVLVPVDPHGLDLVRAMARLEALLSVPEPAPGHEAGRRHEIPVRYGGADGPDLEGVAAEVGLRPSEVVELHAGTMYEVLFLGFAPGFAYLGEVPARLVAPRLATPRIRVPAGSVAVASTMTAVYPQASPGGWRILGRTDTSMFDPEAAPPARLRPGDRVRFVPVR
jgi:5-oxoprolinase (ATP-hydrolysing) subunit B